MPTKKQLEAINSYAAIMEEEKIRLDAIGAALSGQTSLPGQLVREFCYLQLRMLCELIALGCLTAHGDITATETKKLRNAWSADDIIKQLEHLHPTFYPEAAEQDPKDRRHVTAVKSGFLTKAELLLLNGKCGDQLHRGSIKKLLSPRTPFQKHFSEIIDWTQKIEVLLRLHLISLFDGKTSVICMLRDASNNNRSQVAIVERFDENVSS